MIQGGNLQKHSAGPQSAAGLSTCALLPPGRRLARGDMHIPEFANPFNDKTHDDIAIIMSVLVEKANAGATLTTTGGQRAVLRARTLQQLSIHRLSSDARR